MKHNYKKLRETNLSIIKYFNLHSLRFILMNLSLRRHMPKELEFLISKTTKASTTSSKCLLTFLFNTQ